MTGKEWAQASILPLGLTLVAAGAFLVSGGDEPPREALAYAPDFSLPIVAGPGADEGDRISVDGHRGRVLILDFWASWCGVCEQSIPELNRLAEIDERVTLIGVNVEGRASVPQVQAAHDRFGASFPSVQDTGALQNAFSVTAIPTVVVIGTGGEVLINRAGGVDSGRLRTEILNHLE